MFLDSLTLETIKFPAYFWQNLAQELPVIINFVLVGYFGCAFILLLVVSISSFGNG